MREIDKNLTAEINKQIISDTFWVEDAEDIDELIYEYDLHDRAICFTCPGHEIKCFGGDLYYLLILNNLESFTHECLNDAGESYITSNIRITVFKD
jgi:hypothetical protein